MDDVVTFAKGLLNVIRQERLNHEFSLTNGRVANWDEYRFTYAKVMVLGKIDDFILEELKKWNSGESV